mgnify:CR=1 FL=1
MVTTFAGSSTGVAGKVDSVGTNAKFSNPSGIAYVAAYDALFVAETNVDGGNNVIRRITLSDAVVTIFAGLGQVGFVNGVGTAALFYSLSQLTVQSGGGVMFVADRNNNAIRRVTLPGAIVTTAVGSTTSGYTSNTGGSASVWVTTVGAALTDVGELFTSELGNNVIRRMNTMISETTTVACPTPARPLVSPPLLHHRQLSPIHKLPATRHQAR